MLIAFRSLKELTDPRAFRSWLLTIAENVFLDSVRREQRKKRGGRAAVNPAVLATVPGPARRPDEQAEQEELRGRVLAALRSLPEEYRLPLTLRYIIEADYETIETQLGLTNGSLRGLLHRGLKILRSRLEGLNGTK